MSWKKIIKVSSLEREIAEEYAQKDMEDFNVVSQVIEYLEEQALRLLNEDYEKLNDKKASGYYNEFHYNDMTGEESYKYDLKQLNQFSSMISQWIRDLVALRKQGRSHERDKVEPKRTHEERRKQRQEVFGSPSVSR